MVTDDVVAEALNRIKYDAPAQQVDFRDPENAFPVPADFYPFTKHCGRRREPFPSLGGGAVLLRLSDCDPLSRPEAGRHHGRPSNEIVGIWTCECKFRTMWHA